MNIIIFFFVVLVIPVKIMMKQIDDLFLKQNKNSQRLISTMQLIIICTFALCFNLFLWEIMLSAGVDQTFAMTFGTNLFTAEQLMIRSLASLAFALWAPRVAHHLGEWFHSKKKVKD